MRAVLTAAILLVAGCVQIPPSPQELQAKKFESVPGKAVIYIVRAYPDLYNGHGYLWLDDSISLTTLGGQFFRWEVAPGAHRIVGSGQDMSNMTIHAQAGGVYFVQHAVTGWGYTTYGGSVNMLSESAGRQLVQRATLIGN